MPILTAMTRPKRPRDPNQLAKMIADLTTRTTTEIDPDAGKDAKAVAKGRRGGIKGGMLHGATDEIGFHAVENPHYVTDIHATVLHQLGLDPLQLEVPGRKRLDMDRGQPIREIIG